MSCELDLTKPEDVVTLMKTSTSSEEWDNHCNEVKKANGGYPSFWYEVMLKSGLADQILSRWGSDTKITAKGYS